VYKGLYKLNSVDQVGANTTFSSSDIGLNKRASNLSVASPDVVLVSSLSDYKNPSMDTVYARFGHASASKMKHIPFCKHFLPKIFFCDICVISKMHRLPFNISTITLLQPF